MSKQPISFHRDPSNKQFKTARRPMRLAQLLLIAGMLSACNAIDISLRKAAYRPTRAVDADIQKLGTDVQVSFAIIPNVANSNVADSKTNSNEQISLFWFPAKEPNAPSVLYLHGVFRNVFQNAPKIEAIRSSGFNVLAVDYRGWGLSTELVPSEQSINLDVDTALQAFINKEPRPSSRILFGHSLGGAVAIALAHRTPANVFNRLALESSFASTRSLTRGARWYGFLALPLIGNPYDSISLIGQIKIPISMMHGGLDATIPLEQGQQLRSAAPPNTSFEVFANGNHSDLHTVDFQRYQAYWRNLKIQMQQTP